jgi:lipopolysaccharide/colanic/teichoic acid biosynthesis glycosyltransferase
VLNYISEHLDLKLYYKSIILSTDTSSYVEEVDFNNIRSIINLRKINTTQRPNKLFRAVNTLLPEGGYYIGRIESYGDRKNIFFKRFGKFAGELVWLADFVFNRVIPRIRYADSIYFRFTNGRLHCMSIPELLGRLVYCGFEIADFKEINGLTYFVAKKINAPLEKRTSSYYPVIRLTRVGESGIPMRMYKIRTMHPYSEYLQEYIIRMNGYDENGKPANDYRVSRWGKSLRKLWLDELPQLIHVFKGEMKLVGLRPLSKVRFDEFPEDLKAERIKYKPGCIPPYVSLRMAGDKQSIEAERIYINEYNRHPFLTDLKYFGKGIFNIILNRVRHN